MIVVTFRGAPPPLLGRVRDITVGPHVRGPSVCAAMVDAFGRFTIEKDVFLFVAPGGRIHSARVWPVVGQTNWDVAAYVERIGALPKCPGPFSGIGSVHLYTLLIRPTAAGRRVLARWAERSAVRPGNEDVELAIALVETRAAFLQLPRTWVWRESEHRAHEPSAEPVVEFQSTPSTPMTSIPPTSVPIEVQKSELHRRQPEVLWNGHFYSYASYGKINREVLLRVANSVVVKTDTENVEPILVDEYTRARMDAHKGTLIDPRAPFLRFFGPDFRPPVGRHRICWTMMETAGRVHPDMAKQVNQSYDELWVPTRWNAGTFKAGGVRVPIHVVPLGVDPAVYRPQRRRKLPLCRLVSTSKRGAVASPSGFVFLSVGLMSPRKGFDVVADALEIAFRRTDDVDLVLATTHASQGWDLWVREKFAKRKVRVWLLEGRFTEHEMSEIYAGADAYVSASIGEGWNLCAQEAAACGLPIVVPANSAHPDVFGEDDFTLFPSDGLATCPEVEPVSPWYVGMAFSKFGSTSKHALADRLKTLHGGGRPVREQARRLRARAVGMTWDLAAADVVRRLLKVQP